MYSHLSLPTPKWIKWTHLYILTFEFSSKIFGIITLGLIIFSILFHIILNLFVDPYFIFRKSSFEPSHASINSHQRHAKNLQVITRQPSTILLGSSRVYRGFDVHGNIYNMGISSLTLTETASYVDHVLHFTPVHTIVLGLDFWMFDKEKLSYEGWDESIGTLSYVIKSFLKTLFNTEPTFGILKNRLRGTEQPTPERWTYEGFFQTQDSSKTKVDTMLASYMNSFKKVKIQLDQIIILESIIQKCLSKGINLYVYISPLHPETKNIYMNSQNAPYFNLWKEKISAMCKKHNVSFHDFSELLKNSPPLWNGSDKFWLDYSHFKPNVGQFILQTLGIESSLINKPFSSNVLGNSHKRYMGN